MISINSKKPKPVQSSAGFALLITLIVVSVVVSIGLTLLDITIKQIRLASGSKDSEIAFHAANAGMECARYWRRVEQDDFETLTPGPPADTVTIDCFDQADQNVQTVDIGGGTQAIYKYKFEFTGGSLNDRCSVVTMITLSSDPDAVPDANGFAVVLLNVADHISGYPVPTKGCQPGGRCTIISAQGYNKSCANKNVIGTVQREVLLEF
jgi:hypothetical protein